MKIVLSNPYCWPYVRRGSERYMSDLARYLTASGHEVVTIATKPGPGVSEAFEGGGTRLLGRHLWHPWLQHLRLDPAHAFLLTSLVRFATLDADVIHSLYYLDGWAATLFRNRKRFRTVLDITGVPVPWGFPRRYPPDRWIFAQAMRHADRRLVHSQFARRTAVEYYGLDAEVLPVPIDLEQFPVGGGPREPRPVILSVASFDDRRKGAWLLARAFEMLKREAPRALLRLSGHMSPEAQADLLGSVPERMRSDIEILGVGNLQDLPRLYAEASLTVLASMWEVFGKVVVESWAAGTPVVIADHGALPELLEDPETGVLFDPTPSGMEATNVEGLAAALLAGLKLAEKPGVRARCRKQAERFTWAMWGPEYEKLYASLGPRHHE